MIVGVTGATVNMVGDLIGRPLRAELPEAHA
jgi:hypothetical protein